MEVKFMDALGEWALHGCVKSVKIKTDKGLHMESQDGYLVITEVQQ